MRFSTVTICGRKIGPAEPIFVIAEMSGNHNGSLSRALELMEAAQKAGADAVKLQTYTADTITIDHDSPEFRIKGGLWDSRTLYDLYEEAHTPWEWHRTLFEKGRELGLIVFSTAFDSSSVDFLESLNSPAYKIASFENVDLPLLRRIARNGRPMIVSTGMASMEEIEEAVSTIRKAGGRQLALLKCTSAYPAPPEEMNLLTIPHLADTFGVPVGLSDHTLGIAVPVAAAALGACIIEKHITLSRKDRGPDSAFSLEAEEFKQMVEAVRTAKKALGKVSYGQTAKEVQNRVFRRSLFVVEDMEEGDIFSSENVRCIRPSHGLHPRYLDEVIGRRASKGIAYGTALAWDLIEGRKS